MSIIAGNTVLNWSCQLSFLRSDLTREVPKSKFEWNFSEAVSANVPRKGRNLDRRHNLDRPMPMHLEN